MLRGIAASSALLVALFAAPAVAQEPQAQPQRSYVLVLTGMEIAQIGAQLADGKYRDVTGIIAKISAQIDRQNKQPAPPAPDVVSPKPDKE